MYYGNHQVSKQKLAETHQGRIQPKSWRGAKKISTYPVKLCPKIRKFLDIFVQMYKNSPVFFARI